VLIELVAGISAWLRSHVSMRSNFGHQTNYIRKTLLDKRRNQIPEYWLHNYGDIWKWSRWLL